MEVPCEQESKQAIDGYLNHYISIIKSDKRMSYLYHSSMSLENLGGLQFYPKTHTFDIYHPLQPL